MKLSPTARRNFDQVRQILLDQEPRLAWLKEVAKVGEQYAADVQELLDMRDHLAALCEGCLAATAGGNNG